ncbi:hypothetical protein GCM10027093_68590 [Paraburkholderia jirisanensis]
MARERRLENVLTRICDSAGIVIGTIIAAIINSHPALADTNQLVVNQGAGEALHRKAIRSCPNQCGMAAITSHAARLTARTPNCNRANSRLL